ncbi:FCD domain-containing protein [Rosistilla oblonga]|uniref:GntR family transcriptional regulator n=1 Tax=Rosistilla oblonga TaxID=2527990 RepID=UPI003A977C73
MSITDFIRNDLALRLRSGRDLPAQLTLDSLAELYNVSFTPVRAAVADLIDEGLLRKGANRRLEACPLANALKEFDQLTEAPKPPADPSEKIADDLVLLSLEGKSVYLREEVTAEKYSLSRSAIRNILHQLAGEGMLDHIPRRGWRLRPFRQDDLQAFIEVREAMELKALQLARPRLDNQQLQAILERNAPPASPTDRFPVDESLHEYLVATSGNGYIRDFFDRQGRYFRLLFRWEDNDRSAALETLKQHRDVVQALLDEDWASAEAALSHHIRSNHPVLMTKPPTEAPPPTAPK